LVDSCGLDVGTKWAVVGAEMLEQELVERGDAP
jgi:hypothetical protein